MPFTVLESNRKTVYTVTSVKMSASVRLLVQQLAQFFVATPEMLLAMQLMAQPQVQLSTSLPMEKEGNSEITSSSTNYVLTAKLQRL
jgi:hypothetical protein